MEEVLKCLNQNSGSIGVLFSGLVTLATLVYAILTWKLAAWGTSIGILVDN